MTDGAGFKSWAVVLAALRAAVREGFWAYLRVSLGVYGIALLVLLSSPGGLPMSGDSLLELPLLYLSLWLGPVDLMVASHTLVSGVCLLLVAAALGGFGVLASRSRAPFLTLSAVAWFMASFAMLLSESV